MAYQNGVRITGEFDSTDSNGVTSDSMGAEVGIGNGDMGMALGYYQVNDCDACEEQIYGGFGILLGDFLGFGVSGEEELYNAGIILNPKGKFRFGVVASYFNFDGDDNNVITYGAGFSYYGNNWAFTVDASKREFEQDTPSSDIIKVTPGLKMTVDFIHLSVNLDNYINEPEGTNVDDDVWLGLGLGHGDPFNVNFYLDYQGDWTLVGSVFF